MQVYFTDKRRIVDSITGEVFDLEEEHGVWTWEKKIYVYNKLSRKEKLKTLIHEVVECFLVVYLGMRQERAHKIASLVERVVGKAIGMVIRLQEWMKTNIIGFN
jgi:hypothetical protein